MYKAVSVAAVQLSLVASFAYVSNHSHQKTTDTLNLRLVSNKSLKDPNNQPSFGEATESLLVL